MASFGYLSLFLLPICLFVTFSSAADPFAFFDFEVSYITASPLGIPQQVCFCWILFSSSVFFFFHFWGVYLVACLGGFVLDLKIVCVFISLVLLVMLLCF